MAITPRYGWEVADGPDAPNVPFYMMELATDIETTVAGLFPQGKLTVLLHTAAVAADGSAEVLYAPYTFKAVPYVFATAYAGDGAPQVVVVMSSTPTRSTFNTFNTYTNASNGGFNIFTLSIGELA